MANHLLSLWDFDKDTLASYIMRAIDLKKESKEGIHHHQLAGKVMGMIFEKPSTRTRVSFESAMYGLGGQVIYMSGRDTQLARNEPLKDMARVMARYVDIVVVRTFGQEVVEELARYSSVPVINALTDLFHPCQILSDIMTVVEQKGSIEKLKIAWVGDGNNMANTWIQAASRFGFELTLACPEGYDPDPAILERAKKEAGKPIILVRDPATAVMDADVVNCDVWASMGKEDEQEKRLQVFQPYQVNRELLRDAKPGAVVLHCLPAHRGEEITDDVLEGSQCPAFDQAENKMHIHKAILEKHLIG
ncbi:MAG: ornithine carbamoyltransferase [Desulfobulbaceae bacterium]|uniref:Ornithine carbamoyltransferase n=1 Tax=Candidatus Desulfobia pelagia TaxID=2841692 RepID=A0A8J6TCE7_9BACT|nr:ornithine carbamoyltransferase [Candidatus Desulfobia pelagia]